MQAIIQLSGRQFRVKDGTKLRVNRLAHDVGVTVECTDVVAVFDEHGMLVEPSTMNVDFTVLGHELGSKCQIFKKIRRHGYQRLRGHRQHQTLIQIKEVATKAAADSSANIKAEKKAIAKKAVKKD